jgi:hypothetical protein
VGVLTEERPPSFQDVGAANVARHQSRAVPYCCGMPTSLMPTYRPPLDTDRPQTVAKPGQKDREASERGLVVPLRLRSTGEFFVVYPSCAKRVPANRRIVAFPTAMSFRIALVNEGER